MCGRFANSEKLAQTALRLETDLADEVDWEPSWNCSPGSLLPAIIEDLGGRRLGRMRWGWQREWKPGLLINARLEKSGSSRLWASALEKRRCAVPCTGWWEWLKEGRSRRPHFHHLADGAPFSLAGLWERSGAEGVFVVMTTAAVPAVAAVHDRMPVILEDPAVPGWLGAGELPGLDALPEITLHETAPFGSRDDGPGLVEPLPG